MKRNGIWIIIIIILIAVFWYYCDSQKKKFEDEKAQAIAEAVAEALENERSKQNVHEPPVRTKIVYVEKEAEKPKTEKVPNVFTDDRDGKQYKFIEVDDHRWMELSDEHKEAEVGCTYPCPNNVGGRCGTEYLYHPRLLHHPFDGKNRIK